MRTVTTRLRRALALGVGAARRRLGRVIWAIVQTSVAAGLAWYITHTLLGPAQPFLAPIAAAVSLSASNVLRGQRALQLIGGVALGIVIGVGDQTLLGTGVIALGVGVLISPHPGARCDPRARGGTRDPRRAG